LLLIPCRSHGADLLPNEGDFWSEIADVRIQVAQGHELLSDVKKAGVFRARDPLDPVTPGDELDLAGDEKYLAFEEYQRATKHWENAAEVFSGAAKPDKAKKAQENAVETREAARRSLLDAIDIHRMAYDYYLANDNLTKKTDLLAKIARNLELLIELEIKSYRNSVS
jgi:hypothetical protein